MKAVNLAVLAGREALSAREAEASSIPSWCCKQIYLSMHWKLLTWLYLQEEKRSLLVKLRQAASHPDTAAAQAEVLLMAMKASDLTVSAGREALSAREAEPCSINAAAAGRHTFQCIEGFWPDCICRKRSALCSWSWDKQHPIQMLQLRKQLLLRCLELAHNRQRPWLTDPSTKISNRQAWLWSLLALLMLMLLLLLLKTVVSLRLMETLQASDDPPMQVTNWLKYDSF